MLRGYIWWDKQDPQNEGWTLDILATEPYTAPDREALDADDPDDETAARAEAAARLCCEPQEVGVAHGDAEADEMRDHPERW